MLTEEETCPGVDAHIFIFRNDGNQNFVRMPDIVLPGDLPHGLTLADVTGDGNVDIITALSGGYGCVSGERKPYVWSPNREYHGALQI